MGKSNHFSGQPLYSQVTKLLDKSKILRISREHGGERYVKRFDAWTHLVVMLYAVILRFDSLREIMASMQAEARKLCHLGIVSSLPAVRSPMPTDAVLRPYSSAYTVTCTPHTGKSFLRTAGATGNPHG